MRLLTRLTLILMVFALLFSGCFSKKDADKTSDQSSSQSEDETELPAEYPVEAGGIVLSSRPGSVVSLAPALSEKLYDLGMEDRLSGVSDYCDYPKEIVGLPHCGTAQIPDLDQIEELAPHLILTQSKLPDSAMAVLDELNIPVAVLPRADSLDMLSETYIDIARLLEGDETGRLIGSSISTELTDSIENMSRILNSYTAENNRKKVLYLRLPDFTVATGDTFESELLSKIALDNVAEEHTDWTFPEEAAVSAEGKTAFSAVDIILMDEKYVTIKDLEASAFYKGLPAVIKDRYIYISSLAFERQSLRTLYLLEDIAAEVYPDAGLDNSSDADDELDGDYGSDAPEDEMLAALDEMP